MRGPPREEVRGKRGSALRMGMGWEYVRLVFGMDRRGVFKHSLEGVVLCWASMDV